MKKIPFLSRQVRLTIQLKMIIAFAVICGLFLGFSLAFSRTQHANKQAVQEVLATNDKIKLADEIKINVTEAGYETEWGSGPEVKPDSYTLAQREVLVDSGTIKESEGSDKLLILDGRILTQYSGDIPQTAIAEKGGHIPGALSLPAATLFNTDGTFKSAERLEWLFRLYGITRENKKIVVATCNTNSLASNIYDPALPGA